MSLLTLLLLVAADPSSDKKPEEEIKVKSKLVCKDIKITGSRLARRRACATQEEWDRIAMEAQQGARDSMGRERHTSGR